MKNIFPLQETNIYINIICMYIEAVRKTIVERLSSRYRKKESAEMIRTT